MIVFVDFTDSGADRSEVRRMAKNLRKNPVFSHIQGKVLFFKVKPHNKNYFLDNMLKILKSDGFICHRTIQ